MHRWPPKCVTASPPTALGSSRKRAASAWRASPGAPWSRGGTATRRAPGSAGPAAARLPSGGSPGDERTPETPGHRPGVSRGDTSGGASDPNRVESARRTVLYRAPEGPPTGTLAPSAPLRVLGRSGDWTRVQIEGWVKSGDLQAAPAGVLVGVTAAELRADPQRYVGQVLRWTLQFIAVQKADELRP